jgi:hypothetical protein
MKRLTHDEIIAAHDAPRSTRISVTAGYTRIEATYPNSSWFSLTLDDDTGVLSLASDWGDYIYRWPIGGLIPGETFAQFILERTDADYICGKMMSRSQRLELDVAATNEELEKNIRALYDEGGHDHDEDDLDSDLRQLEEWRTIDELREMTFYFLEDHEVVDSIIERETFWCAIIRKMVLPACQAWWAERQERAARVSAERAEHNALYPQHAKFSRVDLESRAIGEFLDFLQDKEYLDEHCPTHKMLIGEFYEIDVKEFDHEKDRMVAALHEQADKEKTP